MSVVVGVLIIIAAAAFVAAPFFSPSATLEEAGQATPRPGTDRQRLERQKHDAYAAIKEAEFDHRMGKITDADFAAVRERYMAQALDALAALEAAAKGPARPHVEGRRPTRIAFCPACGRGVPPRANFCPACGRSLKEAVA